MQAALQRAETEVDLLTEFRCRMIWSNTEKFRMHFHDYYEIFLTLSDNVTHFVNDRSFVLKKNTLVFIRKEDTHYYYKSLKNELSFINIAFTEQLLKSMFEFLTEAFCSNDLMTAEFPPSVVLSEKNKDWLVERIESLNGIELDDTSALKYEARVLIFQIFTKFFSTFANDTAPTQREMPIWLLRLDNKMRKIENFSKPSAHMVALSGKSRAHLGRVLQKHYGKTIPNYIHDLRLNYFANSLINTDIPILELCYNCGFENISWAYTLFKQKYGLSPLKFRNQHSQINK